MFLGMSENCVCICACVCACVHCDTRTWRQFFWVIPKMKWVTFRGDEISCLIIKENASLQLCFSCTAWHRCYYCIIFRFILLRSKFIFYYLYLYHYVTLRRCCILLHLWLLSHKFTTFYVCIYWTIRCLIMRDISMHLFFVILSYTHPTLAIAINVTIV